MGVEFLELMTTQLDKASPLPVRVAVAGEQIRHGQVTVVPIGKRLLIDGNGMIALTNLPKESPYSPSIDQVMEDMADRFGPRLGAIIFSGMATDAIEGSQYIKSKGGKIWVQDPATCVISSMIDGAQEAGVVSVVAPPEGLARQLMQAVGTV
jgi:chemotaxis response regulator CheB